nr:hypothetical protein [Streptomyces sp. TLI_235]
MSSGQHRSVAAGPAAATPTRRPNASCTPSWVLGSQLAGEECCDLAAVLPERARAVFAGQIPLPVPVAAPAFIETTAA